MIALLLWIVALFIGLSGVIRLLHGDILVGLVLIVVAFIVGPGGYSIFR